MLGERHSYSKEALGTVLALRAPYRFN